MKTHNISNIRTFGLQIVLITPFVLQIFAAVGLVGYLSFKNGQKAVYDLEDQLMLRTGRLVDQHLDSYLSTAHKVCQINADAIQMGLLDVRDRKTVGKYFWKQMQAYDLSYISLNLATGSGAAAGRLDGKNITVDDVSKKLPKNVKTYLTDNQGNRTKLLTMVDWDVLNEPLYTEPVKAGKPIWTIYASYYSDTLPAYIAASAARPVYDANKQLVGVMGGEIHLLKLSEFLRKLDISKAGQVFIMERNGMLVANSGKEQPFTVANKEVKRLRGIDSPNPIVQEIANHLQQTSGDLNKITNIANIKLYLQGEPHHVRVVPWRDEYGLDWLVVMSVTESTFMGQINANTRTTILLCFAALVVAIIIGIFTSRWIVNPILRLNKASLAMAKGSLEQSVKESSIKEINILSDSFNYMAEQLRQSFTALEKSNEELESRVEERTLELKNLLIELQRTQSQMIQSEKMSALGQMVAGVAHEINNPVSFIYGNLEYVDNYMKDMLTLIQAYQSFFPNPPDELQQIIDKIELDFLTEDLTKILNSMQVGTTRIREIVLSLRNFSRLDEAEFKEADIHAGIDSTLLILQHRLKAKPQRPAIQVIKEYGKLPKVKCYAGQLNQVFMNILANAIDALEDAESQQNLPTIFIHTQLTAVNDVEISIADNGIGISQEVLSKLFDPFFTTKPVGKGTGLGLSISYQIVVEKHAGKIWCDSRVGEGAKFIIQIPLKDFGF